MYNLGRLHIMTESDSRGSVAEFADYLRGDPALLEAIRNRPQDEPVALEEALDYAVEVATERGFSFSRDELVEAVRQALPEGGTAEDEAVRFRLTVGSLGFKQILVGMSNPSEVMCQYHAPMAILAERPTDTR
jgi:hypothetical protein